MPNCPVLCCAAPSPCELCAGQGCSAQVCCDVSRDGVVCWAGLCRAGCAVLDEMGRHGVLYCAVPCCVFLLRFKHPQ